METEKKERRIKLSTVLTGLAFCFMLLLYFALFNKVSQQERVVQTSTQKQDISQSNIKRVIGESQVEVSTGGGGRPEKSFLEDWLEILTNGIFQNQWETNYEILDRCNTAKLMPLNPNDP